MRTHISMPILCVRNVYTWGPWWLITWLAKEIVSETEMNTNGLLSSGLLDLLGEGQLQGHRDDVDSAEGHLDLYFSLAKPESYASTY